MICSYSFWRTALASIIHIASWCKWCDSLAINMAGYEWLWTTMNEYGCIWMNMNVSQVTISSNKGFLPPCYYTSHHSCQMAKTKNSLLRFGRWEASSSCEALGIHPCANILGAKAKQHNMYMYVYTPWLWYMIMAQSLGAILEARRDTWIINHISYW